MSDLPVRRIIDALADAAQRWCHADFPPRVRASRAIEARTGYSEPVVDYALDRLFGGLTKGALSAAIAGELGALDALDGFVHRQGRPDGFARGVGRVAIVASDTTIGVALPPATFALCAKCEVVVRDRADALVAAFAATLAEESRVVADRLRTVEAGAHGNPTWLNELAHADAVVAFGGDAALSAVRAQLPAHARFVPFGHRTSVAYVEREVLSAQADVRELCGRIARDALLYDGDGCLSTHAVFVERSGALSEERFVHLLAAACDATAVEFPAAGFAGRGPVIAYRDAARFRAALGRGSADWGIAGTHLLVADPPRDEPPPLLPRTLAAYSIEGPAEFLAFARSHALPLEAVGLAALPGRADVAAAALASGAARIGRCGDLQAPSFAGEHGGVGRIVPFVRWVTRDS